MVKIKRRCDNCRQEYWVRLIRVYVLKEHQCGDCKGTLKPVGNGYFCPKCKTTWNKDDPKVITQIRGSSSKLETINKWKEENAEIEKVNVPEKRFCQRCRNMASIMENMQKNKQRGGKVAEIPADKYPESDILKYEIQRKVQEEYRIQEEKRMKEKREAEVKAKLLKKTSEELLKKEKKNDIETDKTIDKKD
jgi:thiol-disulfide isomerase/thioredoxin